MPKEIIFKKIPPKFLNLFFPHFIKLLNVELEATNFPADTKRKTKAFRKRSDDV